MKRSVLIAVWASLSVGAATARTLELIEGAYEARLSEVTWPSSASGTLAVRMCAQCEARLLQLAPETTYLGANGARTFADFRDDIARLEAAGPEHRTALFVFYRLGTNQVTRVSLHTR